MFDGYGVMVAGGRAGRTCVTRAGGEIMKKIQAKPGDLVGDQPTEAVAERPSNTPLFLQLRTASYAEGAAAVMPDQQGIAALGVSGGASVAPHLSAVQRSFGAHDISNVRTHVGGKAAQAAGALGAEAYATGQSVAFAKAPDLHTAAHEYAHVVQQRAGVQLSGGVGRAGDSYEQHADAVADLVVAGRSAESKLGEMTGAKASGGAVQTKTPAIQKRNDNNVTHSKTPLTDLDAKSLQTIIATAKKTAMWKKLVKSYADKTTWGYVELPPNDHEEMMLQLMIWVDDRYQFADAQRSLTDELLGRSDVQSLLVRAVRTSVFEKAPTAVWGALMADAELVNEDDKKVTVKRGKVVKLIRAEDSETFVVEGISNKQKVTGKIDAVDFQRQPGLTTYDHDDNVTTDEIRKDYGYVDYTPEKGKELTSDGADPSVSDVSQGAIGDCYLMAGMGAVVAQRPDLIKKMIQYDASTGVYTVTFKERVGDKFKDVPIQVNASLPSGRGINPSYASGDVTKGGNNAALWPAIIEKAFAVWKGDYEEIVGGTSSKAMEVITGSKSKYSGVPPEDRVIEVFRAHERAQAAVCAGTVDYIDERKEKLFMGVGAGPFRTTLPGSEGSPARIVKGSVKITDTGKGKGGVARDDKQGKVAGGGVKEGSITYKGGATSVTYKDGSLPEHADDIEAKYRYKRLISKSLNLYGNHAYMFVKVEDDKLVFANPWGSNASWQPKPMTAAEFRTFFGGVSVNTPPEAVEKSETRLDSHGACTVLRLRRMPRGLVAVDGDGFSGASVLQKGQAYVHILRFDHHPSRRLAACHR